MNFQSLKHAALFAALACVFALSITGCSQGLSPVERQQILPSTITNWHDAGFANANNPYDYIGAWHNQGLNYVGYRLGKITADTLYPTTDTLAVHFADSVPGYIKPSGVDDSLVSNLRHARYAITHIDSINTLNVLGTIDYNSSQQLQAILNSGSTAGAMIDSIKSFEGVAIASLTGNHQTFALTVSAVARYSVAFWSGPDSSLFPDILHHQPRSRPKTYMRVGKRLNSAPATWNFWKEVILDVLGGVGGSLAGPVGTFIGAEVGSAGYVVAEW